MRERFGFHPHSLDSANRWCLVGNVVAEHRLGESGETRRGSKQFSAGTKVYCLPPQWGDAYEKCVAVGNARGSRRWITVVMSTDLIENWRRKVVYDSIVAKRLADGFQGFNRQWVSAREIDEIIQILSRRQGGRAVKPSSGAHEG